MSGYLLSAAVVLLWCPPAALVLGIAAVLLMAIGL